MKLVLMYEPSAAHLAALEHAAPGAGLLVAHDGPSAARLIRDADAVLGNRYFLQSLPHAQRLRWMQSNSAGVDRILAAADQLDTVTITCARGVYDDEMAEHTLALALGLTRGLHHARANQLAQRWERTRLRTIAGLRCLILGWGGVGQATARRLRMLGAQVAGVRRREAEAHAEDMREIRLWSGATWRVALPQTDLLILALPLTSETYHLVGAEELALLPSGALVINVGRGGTLDEDALLKALLSGRLGGAGLDVLEQEPLPEGHPLWSAENLLLTPHVARSMEQPPYRWEPLFVENLRRFSAGERLLNVVDKEAGY